MVSQPQAPDPVKTAQAQAQYNTQTAATQQAMNMVDQVNPWGSSTYSQNGTNTVIGADGQPITVPHYLQTTTLSPEQQAIFEQTQAAQGNLAGIAVDQSAAMRDYLNNPFSYSPGEHEAWAGNLYDNINSAKSSADVESLRTRLANQGIMEGSPAYDAAMRNLTSSQSTARDRFMLDSYNTGFNTALTSRNQPINELSALLSGSQVSAPQFQSTPQTGVGGVDYTGLVNSNYQAQLQSANAGMGGLFGLAGTLGGAAIKAGLFSDRRLKANIRKVGMLDNGLPIYSYTIGDGPVQVGVMADEVASVIPEAIIHHPSGYLMVDYGIATEAR